MGQINFVFQILSATIVIFTALSFLLVFLRKFGAPKEPHVPKRKEDYLQELDELEHSQQERPGDESLPSSQPLRETQEKGSHASQEARKKTILVVDDTPEVREILTEILTTLDYHIDAACDGTEALKKIINQKPNLIILDIIMPKRNGYMLCRELKSNPTFKDIPIIILTSKTEPEVEGWIRDFGAEHFLTKPFSTRTLV